MIVYDPFWKTLKERGMTTYTLIKDYEFSSHTIHRLRHNSGTSTSLLNLLCEILDCKIEDIVEYIPDEKINEIK